MSQEIPASIMMKLEAANAELVDTQITLPDGVETTITEAYPVQDDETGAWSVVLDFSNRTFMDYDFFLCQISGPASV